MAEDAQACVERGFRTLYLKVGFAPDIDEARVRAVRAAVESGDCATAISDLVVAQSLAAKTLHRVKIDLPRRSFYVLRHKERYASHVEKALIKWLNI